MKKSLLNNPGCPTAFPFPFDSGRHCCKSRRRSEGCPSRGMEGGGGLEPADPMRCCWGEYVPCPVASRCWATRNYTGGRPQTSLILCMVQSFCTLGMFFTRFPVPLTYVCHATDCTMLPAPPQMIALLELYTYFSSDPPRRPRHLPVHRRHRVPPPGRHL